MGAQEKESKEMTKKDDSWVPKRSASKSRTMSPRRMSKYETLSSNSYETIRRRALKSTNSFTTLTRKPGKSLHVNVKGTIFDLSKNLFTDFPEVFLLFFLLFFFSSSFLLLFFFFSSFPFPFFFFLFFLSLFFLFFFLFFSLFFFFFFFPLFLFVSTNKQQNL